MSAINTIETLASAIHEHYCQQAKNEGWANAYDLPYSDLPPEIQEANLAAARRSKEILELAGLAITPTPQSSVVPLLDVDEVLAILNEQMEPLAVREHDLWSEQKLSAGWTYAPERDNHRKHHPCLIPYEDLPEEEKEKDRSNIRKYPSLIIGAGMGISKSS